MQSQNLLRLGLIALTVATTALGCTREDTLRVVVPSGYQGHVMIPCIGVMDANRTITVESNGRAADAACPKDELHVVVVRDGVIVSPAKGINWDRTGDGIPVGLEFDLR